MAAETEPCRKGHPVPYNLANCPTCGTFVGAPNVRQAKGMRTFLMGHYNQAVAQLEDSDLLAERDQLESIVANAFMTIAMDPPLLRNLAEGDSYRSYYQSRDDRAREIAAQSNQRNRSKVDDQLHTGYHEHIIHAALSPDGRYLSSYGSVGVALRKGFLDPVSSLLRENDFDFFRRHQLGDIDAEEPMGWRAAWEDRAYLAVAKVAGEIAPGMTADELADLIMSVGPDRQSDRFIEVHIYGRLGAGDLAVVTCSLPRNADDELDLKVAREKLEPLGIVFEQGTA